MSVNWGNYRYFSAEVDFPAGDPEPGLLDLLEDARDLAGVPFIITSGFRTPEKNALVGGSKNSAHLRGLAADIRAQDPRTRFKILESLFLCGARRIGVYETHIHVDVDDSLDPLVCFLG